MEPQQPHHADRIAPAHDGHFAGQRQPPQQPNPEPSLKQAFLSALLPSLSIIGVMGLVHLLTFVLGLDLYFLGILPRELAGSVGIISAPLIHHDFGHLFSNISALAAGLMFLYMVYPRLAWLVVLGGSIGTNVLVWLLAREAYHIGASGLVYGVVFFLLFSGVFRRDVGSIAVAFLTLFMNQGMMWGVLPFDPQISWESHLYGAVMGIFMAYAFRNVGRKPKKPLDNNADHDAWDYRKHIRT